MPRLLSRTLAPLLKKGTPGEGVLRGPTADMRLLAHPVPKKEPEAGLEKEPTALPALRPAVRSVTLIPLRLGLDPAPPRRGQDSGQHVWPHAAS